MTDAETIKRLQSHADDLERAAKSADEIPGGAYWAMLRQGAAWMTAMRELMR